MAKIRLNNQHREDILEYLKHQVRNVRLKDGFNELAEIYYSMSKIATERVKQVWPAADMEVLRKYEKAVWIQELNLDSNRRFFKAKLLESVLAPGHRLTIGDGDFLVHLDKTADALSKAVESENEAIMSKYRVFIKECKTWEEVVEVLPELKDKAEQFVGRSNVVALSHVSPDLLESIKKDAEIRAALEAAAKQEVMV